MLWRIEPGEGEIRRRLTEQYLIRRRTAADRKARGVRAHLPDRGKAGQCPSVVLRHVVHGILGAELRVEPLRIGHRLFRQRVVVDGVRHSNQAAPAGDSESAVRPWWPHSSPPARWPTTQVA